MADQRPEPAEGQDRLEDRPTAPVLHRGGSLSPQHTLTEREWGPPPVTILSDISALSSDKSFHAADIKVWSRTRSSQRFSFGQFTSGPCFRYVPSTESKSDTIIVTVLRSLLTRPICVGLPCARPHRAAALAAILRELPFIAPADEQHVERVRVGEGVVKAVLGDVRRAVAQLADRLEVRPRQVVCRNGI